MKPVDDTKETVMLREVSRDNEGGKLVEKVVAARRSLYTLKHIEKKLVDKGVQRQDRRPADGIPLGRQHKSGHSWKYPWEGHRDFAGNELDPAPVAVAENDPNYMDEEAEAEARILRGAVSGVVGLVVGEIKVPKLAKVGVARVDLHPLLRNEDAC